MANSDETLRKLEELLEAINRKNNFPFKRDGESINSTSVDSSNFANVVENTKKQVDEVGKKIGSLSSSLGRDVPTLKNFLQVYKKNTEGLSKALKEEQKVYNESAKAMDGYVRKVGSSSDKLQKLNQGLHGVQTSVQKLQDKVNQRTEAEKKINAVTQEILGKNVSLGKNLNNMGRVLNDLKKEFNKREAELKENARKQKEDLGTSVPQLSKERGKIQREADLLKAVIDSLEDFKGEFEGVGKDLREEIKKIDLTQIKDPKLRSALETIIKNQRLNTSKIAQNLEDVDQSLDGMLVGLKTAIVDAAKHQAIKKEWFADIMANLGKTIVTGFADGFRKEIGMVQTRQMRAGGQFQQIIPAALMGMGEADLLRIQDERRYLLRRIALESGEAGGAADFVKGGGFQDIQKLGKELGFRGADAAEAVLGIAESLRVTGIDATQNQLSETVKFLKQSQKDFGVTQEQMLNAFRDMTQGGMMGILASQQGRFASADAMQKEVEMRMELARRLNQDIEIQKKRARELASTVFGDPSEAFKKSIMAGIVGRQFGGLSEREATLMERRRRGAQLTVEETKIADAAFEKTRRGGAGEYADRMRGGNILAGAPVHAMMGMAGMDMQEAAQEATMAAAGQVPGVDRTKQPATEMHKFAESIVRAREIIDGLAKSSLGSFIAGVGSAIGSLGLLAFNAALASSSLRRLAASGMLGGLGGRMRGMGGALGRGKRRMGHILGGGKRGAALGMGSLARGAGRIAPLAVAGSAIGSMYDIADLNAAQREGEISNTQRREGIGESVGGTVGGAAGMWAGAKAGGLLGGAAGAATGPGAIITGALGALIGGTAGWFGGQALGSATGGGLATMGSSRERRNYIRQLAAQPVGATPGRFSRQTGDLTQADRDRLTKIQEEHQKLSRRASTDYFKQNATQEDTDRLNARISDLQSQSAAIMSNAYESNALGNSRQKTFELLAMYEDKKSAPGAVAGPAGIGRNYLEYQNKRGELFQHLQELSEQGKLSDTFTSKKELGAVLKSIEGEEGEKADTLRDALLDVLANIDENTEKSANIEETMYQQQADAIRRGSDMDLLRRNLASIDQAVSDMTPTSKNVAGVFG